MGADPTFPTHFDDVHQKTGVSPKERDRPQHRERALHIELLSSLGVIRVEET
jgi:hypothetical protein